MRKLHILAAAAAMTASSLFADVQIGKGLSLSGYLDMTYQNAASSGNNSTKNDASGFNVATAEIDIAMDFGGGLTAQIDLEGNVQSDNSAAPNTGDIAVEQARIDYAMGQGTLTLGKFDTFIGLEGLEAPDLYQYSNSLTFALEPTQHEGLAYAFDNGQFNFAAAIVNSLGSNNGNGNGDSEELSYAVHLGFTPSEALSLNLNYGTEANSAPTSVAGIAGIAAGDVFDSTLLTADLSYSNHGWTVGAEYVVLDEDRANAAGAVAATGTDTTAMMLMVNYMISEQFGLTARYSTAETDVAAGAKPEATEISLAASYAVTPNWSALIEFRSEEFKNGYTNGQVADYTGLTGTKQDADVITLETILTF
jgi:hypothetical protein